MSTEIIIIIAGVSAVLLGVIASQIRVVKQSEAWVMERIGVYSRTWHTGLHIKVPFIEQRRGKPIDLREQILVCGETLPHNHGHYHNHRNGYVYGDLTGSVAGDVYGDIRSKRRDSKDDVKTDGSDVNVSAALPSTPVNVAASINSFGQYATQKLKKEGQWGAYTEASAAKNINGMFGRNAHNHRVHSPKSQPVITKDNVSMEMDTVVFYQVTDPKLFAYGHKDPLKAVEHIVATSLRNIVGGLELDETLTSREIINDKIRRVLDEATDAWGIKVTRVELRNIIISDVELAEAMEQQMIAERQKRARVIEAEGFRKSEILKAEGKKQAEILEAEGKAEAIRLVNEARPSQEFLTIRALEAYEIASDGKATKIIVPSNLQSLAGLALTGSEVFKEGEKMEAPHVDIVD